MIYNKFEKNNILIFSVVSLFLFFSCGPAFAAEARSVRYILFKALDADSSRAVNGASIIVNKREFMTSSPSGLFKVDIQSDKLKGFDFLELSASREGYDDATLSVSLKEPAKIAQPVKLTMKQKMGKLKGRLAGCWYDSDGHHPDKYSGDEIKVMGRAISTQQVLYKFNADDEGNFTIFNLPVGTYEIEVRHKIWSVSVEKPGQELEKEFTIRKCNREEFHKNTAAKPEPKEKSILKKEK